MRMLILSVFATFLALLAPPVINRSYATVDAPNSDTMSAPLAQALTITTTALPQGTIGQGYSSQLTSSGGLAPVTFSMTGGALPEGLSLNAAGLISGTPTAAGVFNFTVSAADSSAQVAQRSYDMQISSLVTLSVNPPSLTIARSQTSVMYLTYQLSGQGVDGTYASSSGRFMAGGEVLLGLANPITARVSGGAGAVTEALAVPMRVIEMALKKGLGSFSYVRTFTPSAGGNGSATSATVNFTIGSGVSNAFAIKGIDLMFENSRPEATVERNAALAATARVGFTGTGIMRGYWQVDGNTISTVEQLLNFGDTITLRTPQPPALPTSEPGTHTLKFVITSPETALALPEVSFTVIEPAPKPKPRNANFTLLTPTFGMALRYYAPVRFLWTQAVDVEYYVVSFNEPGAAEPLYSAYSKQAYYTISDVALRKFFTTGKVYEWRVTGYDAAGAEVAKSSAWAFSFSADK